MNTLFWLVSVLILAIGIYILTEKKTVYTQLSDATLDPAALFVCFGAILFLITFCGCIGALRENVCFLTIYAVAIGLIFAIEIAAGVLAFTMQAKLEEAVDNKLKQAILKYRESKFQDLQLLIDTAQKELKCCGSRSYKDWRLNIYFNCSAPSPEACGVPFSCCRTDTINRQCGFEIETNPDKFTVIYTNGCLNVAKQWLLSNLLGVGIASLVILVLQIVAICLATGLKSDIKVLQKRNKRIAKAEAQDQRRIWTKENLEHSHFMPVWLTIKATLYPKFGG